MVINVQQNNLKHLDLFNLSSNAKQLITNAKIQRAKLHISAGCTFSALALMNAYSTYSAYQYILNSCGGPCNSVLDCARANGAMSGALAGALVTILPLSFLLKAYHSNLQNNKYKLLVQIGEIRRNILFKAEQLKQITGNISCGTIVKELAALAELDAELAKKQKPLFEEIEKKATKNSSNV